MRPTGSEVLDGVCPLDTCAAEVVPESVDWIVTCPTVLEDCGLVFEEKF